MATFHIRTYGCQMNERDSEALACLLERRGHVAVESEDAAHILLFNTCSVRDQAERKVFGKLGILKKRKRLEPDLVIGVIGCMAQNHGRELIDKLPHVDLVVGTDRLDEIPKMLEDIRNGSHGLVSTDVASRVSSDLSGHRPGSVTAYVSVMRGCNQFCSYCIVPYTRGREKSRSIPEIVAEVSRLADAGTKEILLLGQNVTAYGLAELRGTGVDTSRLSPFADLLRAVHDVDGIRRIRFTSPHVRYMNDAFVEALCSLPKVCKSFHIPLQSGSDRILRMMNRGYTAAEYLERVNAIRSRLDPVAFSTDVIVGFPSETEDDFEATRRMMDEVRYDMAYIFKYSPREGTKAAERCVDDLTDEVKLQRNKILLADLDRFAAVRNRTFVGHETTVLVEGPSKRNSARWTGRTDTGKVCIFDPTADLQPGDMVRVGVTRTTSHSLFGSILG